MINDFKISGFRHFNDVRLTQLKRVNLFVGKNSAGKSALLEALILFFSQMSLKYLPEIHHSRQENWDTDEEHPEATPLRHLFSDHKLPEVGHFGFELSSSNDDRSFVIQIQNYQIDTDGPIRTFRLFTDDEKENSVDPEFLNPCLVMVKSGQVKRVVRLDRYQQRRIANHSLGRQNPTIFFVPTSGIDNRDLAALWDSVSLTDAEVDVIAGLKFIEPTVEGLAFVGSGVRQRIPLVRLKNHSEPVALRSLGDGMSRILQIILSLVNAKNNVLIIDEFENGLHWSVQAAVWNLVFRLSKHLNVQVFASTHSRDCIEGFEKAWAKDESEASFTRLQKINGEAVVREYTFDLLKDSIETDVEVR